MNLSNHGSINEDVEAETEGVETSKVPTNGVDR